MCDYYWLYLLNFNKVNLGSFHYQKIFEDVFTGDVFGGKFVGMRYVYLLILIQFTLSSCTTDNSGSFSLPSTSTSGSTSFFSNTLLKGPSSDDDLSNKGLICKVGTFAEFLLM